MFNILRSAIIIVIFLPLITHCAPEACFEETDAMLKATFYDNITKEKKTPDSLTVYGSGLDTKLYNRESNVQQAHLPLNASDASCTFIIRINGIDDTLVLSYSSYPHLVSKECGYTFFHKLGSITYTTNMIDYIYTGKTDITTVNEENIRIFY